MPNFLVASTTVSLDGLVRSELWLDAVVNGTYVHPRSGQELPKYDLTSYTVRHMTGRQVTRKENGIHRVLMPDGFALAGRRVEFLDKAKTELTYSLSKAEQTALRSAYLSGLPGEYQLWWEREIRGPMSPTVEQSVMYAKHDTGADGTTVTITNPTSGNLLVLSHGYYWRGTTLGDATATGAGGTTFTNRGQAGSANFENYQCIMDRISNGAEGTTITVTNGGVSQENSGGFFEVSGMEAAPFVAISAGADGGTGTVTTIGTGNVDTTGTDNTWLIAAFGTENVISGRTYDPTSFVEAGTIQGTGDSDHGTSIALRTVSAASTYACAMSWTTACTAAGIVAAYEIVVAAGPSNTIPDDTTGIFVTSLEGTVVDGMEVAEGDDPLVSITVSCVSGKGTWSAVAQGSASVSGNGTNSLVITNGSLTDKNNTLALATWAGAAGVREAVTVTLLSSDGTLTDESTFTIWNDPTTITLTALEANFADLVSTLESVEFQLHVGQIAGQATVTATDDDDGVNEQMFALFVPSSFGAGGFATYIRRRRR